MGLLLHHMEGATRTSTLPTTNTNTNNRDNRPGPSRTMMTTTCGNLIILSGSSKFYVCRGLYVSFVFYLNKLLRVPARFESEVNLTTNFF